VQRSGTRGGTPTPNESAPAGAAEAERPELA